MKIVLGADGYGHALKQAVKAHLAARVGCEVEDLGVHDAAADTPYYRTADEVARRVGEGAADRGILVCGTGMGMCIVANKRPGVFAAVCETVFAAEKSRSINNANVLTLGGMVTTPEAAREIVDAWLDTAFRQGWDDPAIQRFLEASMEDIAALERERFGSSGPD